jgi:glutamine synthetase
MFAEGMMFDGSSIAGWKAINESDMTLMPDPTTACIDPFFAQTTLAIFCDMLEPSTGQPYNRDPARHRQEGRSLCEVDSASATRSIRPRAEFFIFDDVKFSADRTTVGFKLDSSNCRPTPTPTTRWQPRPPHRASRAATSRSRRRTAARTCALEMLAAWPRWASDREAPPRSGRRPARARHQVRPDDHMADQMQIYKYVIHQVAHIYGKTATFMPKPIYGDNGSGMHVPPVDLEGRQAAVRRQQVCRPVGDLPLLHRRHHQARQGDQRLHQPVDQLLQAPGPGLSKRPVLLAYSARNRSASCRIPFTTNPKAKRVEVRFPDPTANPYLAFAAMLMAGLDGIKNKIHPGGHGQGPVRPAAGRAEADPDRCAARCAKRSRASTRTASS